MSLVVLLMIEYGNTYRAGALAISETKLACWAFLAELSAPYIAAHGREAPMAGVPHDLLVGHAIAVSRRDETRPHAVWGDRFEQSALDPGGGSALQQDLADRVRVQPVFSDGAPLGNSPENRPVRDLGVLVISMQKVTLSKSLI